MRTTPLRTPARLAGASLLRLQTDERLAELAIAGHEAAFDAIVVRYRAPIQRYCAGIVGASRAEDATQQVLINAHDALKRTDEVRHLRSWLYRIAHNVSLNVLRAVRDDVPLDDAAADARLASADDGPAESFERSERFRATVAALQELPERQRAALVLRELEGRSHEEIADALGVTKGSARQHLMRARVSVRSAVTALTPYPLVARLSEMGWGEAAAGAGAGATLAKLTAGVAATGALVGGTQQVVVHHRDAADASAAGADIRTTPAVRAAQGTTPAPAAAGTIAQPGRAAPAATTVAGPTKTSTSPTKRTKAPTAPASAPPQPSPSSTDNDNNSADRSLTKTETPKQLEPTVKGKSQPKVKAKANPHASKPKKPHTDSSSAKSTKDNNNGKGEGNGAANGNANGKSKNKPDEVADTTPTTPPPATAPASTAPASGNANGDGDGNGNEKKDKDKDGG